MGERDFDGSIEVADIGNDSSRFTRTSSALVENSLATSVIPELLLTLETAPDPLTNSPDAVPAVDVLIGAAVKRFELGKTEIVESEAELDDSPPLVSSNVTLSKEGHPK